MYTACRFSLQQSSRPLAFRTYASELLENLVVVIDLEQRERVKGYRCEIINSILRERNGTTRLLQLNKIAFVEHSEYMLPLGCLDTANPLNHCYFRRTRYEYAMTAKEAFQFEQLRVVCEEVGIGLELYDDEDDDDPLTSYFHFF